MSAEQTAQLEQDAARLLNNRQLPEAQQLFEQVIAADNTNDAAWMKLGVIHGMQHNHSKAAECLEKALTLNPESTATRMNYGRALLQSGEIIQATRQFEQVLSTGQESEAAWFMLGRCRTKRSQMDAAIDAYQKALAINPDSIQALHGLGNVMHLLDHHEQAIDYLQHVLRLNPNLAQAHFTLSQSLLKHGNPQEALNHLHKAVMLNPENPEFQHAAGRALSIYGKPDVAVTHMRKALQLRPGYTDAQISLAATLPTLGQPDEALQLLETLIEKQPDNIEAITLAAKIDQQCGHTEKAHERIRPLLDAGNIQASLLLAYAAISNKLGETDKAINLMEKALETDPSLTTADRCSLHFSLGKLYDSDRQYQKAFAHYHNANELKNIEFDPAVHTAWIDSIISTFSTAMMATMPHASTRSERPVFVVGMPRSGTTLVEQILSSHPGVFGAGELLYIPQQIEALQDSASYPQRISTLTQQDVTGAAHDYLEKIRKLSPDAERVIDKMPVNYMHLGYIEMLFPDARIIHCKRNPLDTCLSCYFQNFSPAQHYSFSLANLGLYYRNYMRLMEHWHGVSALPILEVQYEDMVTGQETGSRQILEFCGLEWHDNCRDFHTTGRYVTTASFDQVRCPIYDTSVARWENYAEFIQPLRESLE